MTESGTFAVPVIFYQPGSTLLRGHIDAISQQIDIMPTVLNYLGYNQPYLSFGCDLLNTPAGQTYAVNYVNGVYQYHKGHYLLQFDGAKTVALYDFVSDKLLERNLAGTLPDIQEPMENELKAIIQQYMQRMNTDKLVYE